MLRQRRSLPFLNGLRVWFAVVLMAVAAILLYTNLASAKQKSTDRTLSAPARAVAAEDPVELSRDAVTGAQRSKLSASTSVDAQQQQDLDPVYITTLGPPADGSQQAIVMPSSVTVSEEDPWFGPFYTLNDPDRSVSIDILSDYGFIAAYSPRSEFCNFPDYVSSSLALGYQSAASNGFYVRRCPGFEHLTSLYLRVTTYPDAEVYTTHDIRVINASNPTPTTSAPTVTPTATLEANAPPTSTPTATPTVTLEANAPPTSTPTATPTVTLEANAAALDSRVFGDSIGDGAFCAVTDCRGRRGRGRLELDSGFWRTALCTDGLVQRHLLGTARRRQSDRHVLQPYRTHRGHDLLLLGTRCVRVGRKERLVRAHTCQRSCGRVLRSSGAHTNTPFDGLRAFSAGPVSDGRRRCGPVELDRGFWHTALRADGLYHRQRLGTARRRQSDGHCIQAYRAHRGHELLLLGTRCERVGRKECVGGAHMRHRLSGCDIGSSYTHIDAANVAVAEPTVLHTQAPGRET